MWLPLQTIAEDICRYKYGGEEKMLNENIKKLVEYGIQTGLLPETERIYTTNLLLEMFHEDEYEDVRIDADGIRL